jgi:hypothetical protein
MSGATVLNLSATPKFEILHSQFPYCNYAEKRPILLFQTTHITHFILNGNRHHLTTVHLERSLRPAREDFCGMTYMNTFFSVASTGLRPWTPRCRNSGIVRFLRDGDGSPTPNSQSGGLGCLSVQHLAQNLSGMGGPVTK